MLKTVDYHRGSGEKSKSALLSKLQKNRRPLLEPGLQELPFQFVMNDPSPPSPCLVHAIFLMIRFPCTQLHFADSMRPVVFVFGIAYNQHSLLVDSVRCNKFIDRRINVGVLLVRKSWWN